MNFPKELENLIPENKRVSLFEILSEDPRPHYINDENRVYGFEFGGFEIKFKVSEKILTVTDVIKK